MPITRLPLMRRDDDAYHSGCLAAHQQARLATGILTEIDIRQTLKAKLDVDFRRYKILGACNPALAHQALQTELEIGVMLPCNVIVYEGDDATTVVAAVDPTLTIGDRHRSLDALAQTVRDKLGRALARLA
jgi:uncharacterized protein (DUF302 family)